MAEENDRKPSFEDVLEAQFGMVSDRIWMGHDTQSLELRRVLANAIGQLVRDAYRSWYNRMESYKDVDNISDPMVQREPAMPLDGVDLHEGVDMNTVEENTAQSDLVQHGPQFNTSGEQVNPEMRTFTRPPNADEGNTDNDADAPNASKTSAFDNASPVETRSGDDAPQTGNPPNQEFTNSNVDATDQEGTTHPPGATRNVPEGEERGSNTASDPEPPVFGATQNAERGDSSSR